MLFRLILVCVALCASLAVAPAHAVDRVMQLQQLATKLDIAGRQRMLTQRVAKSACFIARDIGAAAHRKQLQTARAQFVLSDFALRFGSVDLDLPIEQDDDVQQALQRVAVPWTHFNASLTQVENSSPARIIDIHRRSDEALEATNNTVHVLQQRQRENSSRLARRLSVTVDVAGRQRMLSQKMMKEACLTVIVSDPTRLRRGLSATILNFDMSLDSLLTGHEGAGIMPASTAPIYSGLRDVRRMWHSAKPLLDDIAAGRTATADDLLTLEQIMEPLLARMNAVVALYADIPKPIDS